MNKYTVIFKRISKPEGYHKALFSIYNADNAKQAEINAYTMLMLDPIGRAFEWELDKIEIDDA